jgi:gamma-glutamylcyclotransferase (GGCT)/AIG2-like uncharacterized protein YtfP
MLLSRLFAYGSFTSGQVHFARISDYVKESKSAHIGGSVYRLEVGFPVLLLEGSDSVEGELLDIEANETLWSLLDEFHGVHATHPEKSLFWRISSQVRVDDQDVSAYTYVLNPQKLPKSAKYIEGGCWREAMQHSPALPSQLSPRQARYVLKLGSSGGREILPIELDLYRELIKLDIIVDKGRRLALTRLGKEVYRYLS